MIASIPKINTRLIAIIGMPILILLGTLSLGVIASNLNGQLALQIVNGPTAIAVDSDGYIFVADQKFHRVLKFNTDGNLIRTWGGQGKDAGKFQTPLGIAVDSSDNVYVSDSGNDRIQKFSNTGNYIDQWGHRCEIQTGNECTDPDGNGPLSKGDGQLYYPNGLILDKNDNLYVTDTFNNRIQKFTNEGDYIFKWGNLGSKDGQFKFPSDITFDSSGYAYVVDFGNHRIQKFLITPISWIPVDKWGKEGTQLGNFKNPQAISRDASNNIYVTDGHNHRVQKFSNEGTYITHWGSPNYGPGSGNGEFNRPFGIALNPSGTNVYVADYFNSRIQKFTQSGDFISNWGPLGPKVSIPFE